MGGTGIVMNPEEFVFSKNRLEFLGFEVTEDGVEPGRPLLNFIPRNMSVIRSWFGLVGIQQNRCHESSQTSS